MTWGCGGTVDTSDLKSVARNGREGSTPSNLTIIFLTNLESGLCIIYKIGV